MVTTRVFYHDVTLLGGELITRGYRKKNIAIYGENSYYWVLSYFAVTASGNTAVFLDYHLPEEELSELDKNVDCATVNLKFIKGSDNTDIPLFVSEEETLPFFIAPTRFEKSST